MADPADQLMARLTPEARPLMAELRALVREVLPGVTETAHLGWSVFQYRAGACLRSMVVALALHPTYINLEFGDGVELPDPTRRLEGTGKRLWHVKIRGTTDARDPAAHALLVAAASRRGLLP